MTIPTRTTSVTSTTSTSSTLTPSRPTSRCSSINSEFSYTSLDHRTMHRPSTPSSSAHKSNPSISSSNTMSTLTSPEQPTTSASPDSPAKTTLSTRRPSAIERSAFLASAPVRSRAQISPRLKNMCPAPSASSLCSDSTTFFSNTSLPSLTSRYFSSFQASSSSSCCLMNPGGVSLEKRRWSNDSTRGIYGGVESTASSGTLSFLSNDDGRFSTSTNNSSEGASIFNEGEEAADQRSKKKKSKKVKKPCPSLALFSFMLKK
ncbi:hypothetical protein K457DRAFT_140965 [Linnemannia elongata AG-77]|uniref:Uncharacterized protein n=1 Tax=Linnemannia elongata AG-77 TaxID=1314771 RepID=A0A197JMD8_9FUNG|nr:hypothetical protein K457DRAFT_140965 [Linnemannia elongata AG-77]